MQRMTIGYDRYTEQLAAVKIRYYRNCSMLSYVKNGTEGCT